ncbi:hypothetical protein Ancab_017769 [Ancistrocladus abbreviatus]
MSISMIVMAVGFRNNQLPELYFQTVELKSIKFNDEVEKPPVYGADLLWQALLWKTGMGSRLFGVVHGCPTRLGLRQAECMCLVAGSTEFDVMHPSGTTVCMLCSVSCVNGSIPLDLQCVSCPFDVIVSASNVYLLLTFCKIGSGLYQMEPLDLAGCRGSEGRGI